MAAPLYGVQHIFDGKVNNWQVHKKRLGQFFIANNITDNEKKRAVLLNGLAEETFKLLDDLVLPNMAETSTYKDLIKKLDSHFSQEKLVMAERYNFYATRKTRSESYTEYVARLKSLATNCNFGALLATVLRDKFVAGLEAGPVLDKLLQQDENLTLARALQIAQQVETASTGFGIQSCPAAIHVKSEPVNIHQLAARGRGGYTRSRRGERFGAGPKQTRGGNDNRQERFQQKGKKNWHQQGMSRNGGCSHCGETMHKEEDCGYREFKCFKCGLKGHLKKMCRKRGNINYFGETGNTHDFGEEDGMDGDYFGPSTSTGNFWGNHGLFRLGSDCCKPIKFEVSLNGKNCAIKVDSGAATSVISEEMYLNCFKEVPLSDSLFSFVSYVGDIIRPIGKISLTVGYKEKVHKLDFHVIKSGGPTLLGMF